ncbi:hypothetical protein [Paraburkholderia silvatlantica]|uniref:hypothetical protein n=1 Tax=Paraburkholderia silvatlantica TaxID=321895 RepID=UPI0011B80AC5|nr:hypothetical protein [Paraburkholderia silvatlantica]
MEVEWLKCQAHDAPTSLLRLEPALLEFWRIAPAFVIHKPVQTPCGAIRGANVACENDEGRFSRSRASPASDPLELRWPALRSAAALATSLPLFDFIHA